MQPIDIGDLTLDEKYSSRQSALFHAVREKIIHGLWNKGSKLPSTRKLASELEVSRNTVIYAYEQLVTEGYIESKTGSGYYVMVEQPEQYLHSDINATSDLNVSEGNSINAKNGPNANLDSNSEDSTSIEKEKTRELEHQTQCTFQDEIRSFDDSDSFDLNAGFAPGVPDLEQFPFAKWQRLLQRHITRKILAGNQSLQGYLPLRQALSDYLASSRSVKCNPNRIIITSGAQQAISIALMATLKQDDEILMEEPGYLQMHKIINLLKLKRQGVPVHEKSGISLDTILTSDAHSLYLTPSNQYPMGTTLNTEQRLKLIEWAYQSSSWVIEDDYDSEFQFAHRPYTSMQGLASKIRHDDRILYVGSLSKVMFNGLRLGYLVVPESLVPRCLEIKDALTGDSAAHTQAALADFISEGDLLRHIRKMRRLYKQKHQTMVEAVNREFADDVDVISQAAGLHVTIKWQGYITEQEWKLRAKEKGIVVRPLGVYEYVPNPNRTWQGVVLGFGNIRLQDIDSKVKEIAQLFYQ